MRGALHGALGLAQRAGQLISGHDAVCQNLVAKRVFLLLIASDAGEHTKRELLQLAAAQGVPVREVLTKQEYGEALGKPARAVVAVMHKAFAEAMLRKIDPQIPQ